jgi:hypothetical protein
VSGARSVWLVAAVALVLALVAGGVFAVSLAAPPSPDSALGSLDPKALPGPSARLSGTIVAERYDMRRPWSVILSVDAGGRQVDVIVNELSHLDEFSAPIEDLTSPGALKPLPSFDEVIKHVVGLRFIGWVRTAHVGPFGLRPALVMCSGSLLSG